MDFTSAAHVVEDGKQLPHGATAEASPLPSRLHILPVEPEPTLSEGLLRSGLELSKWCGLHCALYFTLFLVSLSVEVSALLHMHWYLLCGAALIIWSLLFHAFFPELRASFRLIAALTIAALSHPSVAGFLAPYLDNLIWHAIFAGVALLFMVAGIAAKLAVHERMTRHVLVGIFLAVLSGSLMLTSILLEAELHQKHRHTAEVHAGHHHVRVGAADAREHAALHVLFLLGSVVAILCHRSLSCSHSTESACAHSHG